MWLSDPGARHSRNLVPKGTVAIAVFDSNQSWGKPDRGIQLFGNAAEVEADQVEDAERIYAARFAEYASANLAYRFYRFRPRRVKLFDEPHFGTGVFITARSASGQLTWERTDVYS